MYTDLTFLGPCLTCRSMKQPFRKIFPSSHPNWQRHHRQDIVMAAMCNRGDALMYATEFSQASKPWLEKNAKRRLSESNGSFILSYFMIFHDIS